MLRSAERELEETLKHRQQKGDKTIEDPREEKKSEENQKEDAKAEDEKGDKTIEDPREEEKSDEDQKEDAKAEDEKVAKIERIKRVQQFSGLSLVGSASHTYKHI
ncbi:hypothetical protein Tco_1545995 [Tanacetum coccineum]